MVGKEHGSIQQHTGNFEVKNRTNKMASRKRKTGNESGFDLVIKPIPRTIRAALSQKKDDDTPDGIMLNALHDAYGIDTEDRSLYRKFITELMQNLSRLVTGGKSNRTFEPDFDTFFTLVVRSINSCGEMMVLLEQNGIEYKPKWLDNNDEDEED